MADPYVYPGTGVLRNLAGLQDAATLSFHEAQASTLRLAQLAALRLDGAYDLRHLQEFHRFVFQDVYPWAGDLRSVPLAKLAWENLDAQMLVHASKCSFRGDNDPLGNLIEKILDLPDR